MEINVIELDGERMTERDSLHSYLAEKLSLPKYYGRNLDALYDCLCELPECTLLLRNKEALAALGSYGEALLEVFRDADAEIRHIHFREEDPEQGI